MDESEESSREERAHQERPEDYVVLLAQVPERVADIVQVLDEERLTYRHAPALPTISELVGHLARSGTLVDALFRHVLIDGALEIDLREALAPAGAGEVEAEDALDRFMRDRRRTVDLLRGLDAGRWAGALSDRDRGELTLFEVCDLVGRHEAGHLTQLRNLIAQLPETKDLGPVRRPVRS